MAKKMIKRKDGSYSQRGLWDNIRANKGSGKKPTKEMLEQERKIKNKNKMGGKRKLMKKEKMMYQTGGGNELAGIDAKKFPKEAKFRKKTNKRLAKGKSIDKLVEKNLKRKEKQNLKDLPKPNKKDTMYQKGGKSEGLMKLYENRAVQDTTRRDTPTPVDTKSSEYKKKLKKKLVGGKTKKMMGGGMKKMMYKSGGFLEPSIPNIDDL